MKKPTTKMKTLIRKITLFYALTYILNVAFTLLTPNFPLAAASPTIAFLLLSWPARKWLRPLTFRLTRSIVPRLGLSLLLPVGIGGLAYLLAGFVGIDVEMMGGVTAVFLLGTYLFLILGALLEEIGWRGYLQPLLDESTSKEIAAFVVGFLWSVWHFTLFQNGFWFMVGFTLFAVGISYSMGHFMSGTKNNLHIPILLHASYNLTVIIFFSTTFAESSTSLLHGAVWFLFAIRLYLFKSQSVRGTTT